MIISTAIWHPQMQTESGGGTPRHGGGGVSSTTSRTISFRLLTLKNSTVSRRGSATGDVFTQIHQENGGSAKIFGQNRPAPCFARAMIRVRAIDLSTVRLLYA